ncbi:MAG: bromodomain-containing protein, partial [bacterium]
MKPYHYTGTTSLYPPLLYCWQVCVGSLDVLLAMKNADDGLPTAHFFLHPASFYFSDKQYPPDYLQKVVEPMDLGTVTSNLMEGVYQSVSKFVADCSLVCQNCYKYNGDRADGAVLVAQAQRLQSQMEQQLGALIRYDQTEGTRLGTSS